MISYSVYFLYSDHPPLWRLQPSTRIHPCPSSSSYQLRPVDPCWLSHFICGRFVPSIEFRNSAEMTFFFNPLLSTQTVFLQLACWMFAQWGEALLWKTSVLIIRFVCLLDSLSASSQPDWKWRLWGEHADNFLTGTLNITWQTSV